MSGQSSMLAKLLPYTTPKSQWEIVLSVGPWLIHLAFQRRLNLLPLPLAKILKYPDGVDSAKLMLARLPCFVQ